MTLCPDLLLLIYIYIYVRFFFFFWLYNTSNFSAMSFGENPFMCQCEKENKKALGFQILHFHWSFSNDLMAVKGLNDG